MSVLESIVRQIVGSGIWRALGQEQQLRARRRLVRRSDLGDEWPLTVDEALVHCHHDAVYLTVNGKTYWVNGLAEAHLRARGVKAHKINEIWTTAETSFGPMKSIGPLIDLGRSICNDDPPQRFSRDWWRVQLANVLSLMLNLLILTMNFLSLIIKRLTNLIKQRGGTLVASLLILAGLGVTWLGVGIFLQELWGSIEGFWHRPFFEHGIFYVIAVPFTIVALVWLSWSHRRE